ncbi:thioesterase domain-containing protein [Pedobacter sp. P351]|uniref:thioesterase II family protein n=1 Tax=Pedobacter superstes TaxID=3133441 RepID=UPI0030A1414E
MARNLVIICLPFAGGSKYSYRAYTEKKIPLLEFEALEFPGRGSRIKEPLISNIEDLVDDLYAQCSAMLDKNDYAFYGHSMGGLLAYLLTKKVLENNHKAPLHLFITGTTGPSAPGRLQKKRSLMGTEEFIAEIKSFGGMPDEILENDELLYFFEPILRADFKASENYIHVPGTPLDIPITVITGDGEDMEKADIDTWQKETSEPVDFKVMPGNHFFIYRNVDNILRIIAKKLL